MRIGVFYICGCCFFSGSDTDCKYCITDWNVDDSNYVEYIGYFGEPSILGNVIYIEPDLLYCRWISKCVAGSYLVLGEAVMDTCLLDYYIAILCYRCECV